MAVGQIERRGVEDADPNPAADSDAWIAYSLVEGGRLWNKPAYANLGREMMGLIAQQEVAELPGFGMMLMPGPAAFCNHKAPGR